MPGSLGRHLQRSEAMSAPVLTKSCAEKQPISLCPLICPFPQNTDHGMWGGCTATQSSKSCLPPHGSSGRRCCRAGAHPAPGERFPVLPWSRGMFHPCEGAEQGQQHLPVASGSRAAHTPCGWGRAEGPWGHLLPALSPELEQRSCAHVLSPDLLRTG